MALKGFEDMQVELTALADSLLLSPMFYQMAIEIINPIIIASLAAFALIELRQEGMAQSREAMKDMVIDDLSKDPERTKNLPQELKDAMQKTLSPEDLAKLPTEFFEDNQS